MMDSWLNCAKDNSQKICVLQINGLNPVWCAKSETKFPWGYPNVWNDPDKADIKNINSKFLLCPYDVNLWLNPSYGFGSDKHSYVNIQMMGKNLWKYRLYNLDKDAKSVNFTQIDVNNIEAYIYKENFTYNYTFLGHFEVNQTYLNAKFTSEDKVWLLLFNYPQTSYEYRSFYTGGISTGNGTHPDDNGGSGSGWKTTAIVFIILSIILAIAFLVYCIFSKKRQGNETDHDQESKSYKDYRSIEGDYKVALQASSEIDTTLHSVDNKS